jgi:hypothetical protein
MCSVDNDASSSSGIASSSCDAATSQAPVTSMAAPSPVPPVHLPIPAAGSAEAAAASAAASAPAIEVPDLTPVNFPTKPKKKRTPKSTAASGDHVGVKDEDFVPDYQEMRTETVAELFKHWGIHKENVTPENGTMTMEEFSVHVDFFE